MEAFHVALRCVALRYVTATVTVTLGLRYSYNYDDRFSCFLLFVVVVLGTLAALG